MPVTGTLLLNIQEVQIRKSARKHRQANVGDGRSQGGVGEHRIVKNLSFWSFLTKDSQYRRPVFSDTVVVLLKC